MMTELKLKLTIRSLPSPSSHSRIHQVESTATTAMQAQYSTLTSALVVANHCLPHGNLPHVLSQLNDFLDDFSADCTIADAYQRTRSTRLMQYIAAREDPDAMNPFYKRWLFNKTAEMAAARGDLDALQWLVESYLPHEFLTKAVAAAAANGHLHVLEWLFETHHDRGYWGNTEMCGALANSHVLVVEWLRAHAVPRAECRTEVMDAAAGVGNLDIVKWLHDEHKVGVRSALVNAMSNRQWGASHWILEHGGLVMPWINWDQPAKDGALDFLKFLHTRKIGSPGYFTLQAAAWNGHLDVVKWLHSELGLVLTADAMRKAAQNGHLVVVEWFHEPGEMVVRAWG
ncbi:unnamed protein product [Phytophthora fragariaefolia]|uniref:Unnamed protein product n=1 Tax=Phytophthora fragariaefolia TaxID=1490495 RepID=A0A9W6XVT1_9STRA|nr:unnamed protein product [Phytophthora fragariaefolia]